MKEAEKRCAVRNEERERLIEEYRKRQPIAELRRKQKKASTKHYYTVEDIDLADVEAVELFAVLNEGKLND